MDPAPPTVTVVVVASPGRLDELTGALSVEGVHVVATSDAADLAACIAEGAPDIVVATTGSAELAATASVPLAAPATRVVAVGAADPSELIAGSVGALVPDDAIGSDLVAAVIGLAMGEARIDAPLAAHLMAQSDADGQDSLSPTEREVLTRLADGDEVDTIAESYAVAPRMVRLISGGVLARALLA